jgi:ABC-type glycerol-3-phosphate transport system substrate-binding protein
MPGRIEGWRAAFRFTDPPIRPRCSIVAVRDPGIPVGAKHPDEARALLRFLASPAAQPTVRKTGLDSVAQ